MPTNDKWMSVPIDNLRKDPSIQGSARCVGIVNKFIEQLAKIMAGLVDGYDWAQLFFSKPSDFVLGLYYYPFEVGYLGADDDDYGQLFVGGFKQTLVGAKKIYGNTQYYYLGEVYIPGEYGNFLDYNGFTKIEVFLPYYGYVTINPNDVVNKYLEFRLKVDLLTGVGTYIIGVSNTIVPKNFSDGTCQITSNDNIDDSDVRIIATYDCNIGYEIPITSTELGSMITKMAIGGIKAGVSALGAAASVILPGASKVTEGVTEILDESSSKGIEGGRLRTLGKTKSESTQKNKSVTTYIPSAGGIVGQIFDNSTAVFQTLEKTPVGYSGTMSPFLYMAQSIKVNIIYPKLLNRGVTDVMEFTNLYGKPLGKIKRLRDLAYPPDLEGEHINSYVEIGSVHLEGFDKVTKPEIEMIESAMHRGVIL